MEDEEVTFNAPEATGCGHSEEVAQIKVGRWGKITWFPFEALIGFVLLILGVENVIFPENTEILRASPHIIVGTGVIYLISGTSILIGLWRSAIRVELLGLLFLSLGFLTWVLSGIFYQSEGSLQQALILIPILWAAATRAHELLKGRVTIQVERANNNG